MTPHGATGWWLVQDGDDRIAWPMAAIAVDKDNRGDGYTYSAQEALAFINGEHVGRGHKWISDSTPTDDEARRLLEEAVDYVHFAHNEGEGNAADLERRIWAHLERTPGHLGGERKAVES